MNQHTDEMREALRRLIIERAHWDSTDEMVDFIIRECAPVLSASYETALREARDMLTEMDSDNGESFLYNGYERTRKSIANISKLLGEKTDVL
jgi:hypothetical protein